MLTKKNNVERNQYEENSLFKAIKQWIDNKIDATLKSAKNIKSADVMIAIWREVCDLFDGLKELFDNNELYNLLSLYKMVETDENKVLNKYLEALASAKNTRAKIIKEAVYNLLFPNGIAATVKEVRYPKSNTIRKILVAHNIAITNLSDPVTRFGFHFFDEITGRWDIEHIYSTNEKYIDDADFSEKAKLLEIFSKQEDNSYKSYIETLYDINIKDMQGEMEDKEFTDQCFKNSQKRYDMNFDIWRYLKLKKLSSDLLFKYSISEKISHLFPPGTFNKAVNVKNIFDKIADAKDIFDKAANDFLHNKEYDDSEICIFFRSNYLYWDSNIDREYNNFKGTSSLPDSISWYGFDIKLPNPSEFWSDDAEEKNVRSNFIRNYYRDLLNIVYDNTGISSQDLTFSNHGNKKDSIIIDDDSRTAIAAFLVGTKYRIDESIRAFFKKDESIDPSDDNLGNPADYKTFAAFINDNSMGNMMLLPVSINRASGYRSVNFNQKRKFVDDNEAVFLPIATSNVLMGKYIDLETSTEQWLMNERKKYIEDMISSMSKYYGKK